MGDVLMTTPAIRSMKASAPDRRITLLTSANGAAVAGLVPEIDEVISYDPPWMKASQPRKDSLAEHQMIAALKARQFDAAVIFTVYSQSALPPAMLCYLADIPLRLAYCRENPYQLLTHWVAETEPEKRIRHEVRRQLDLVASVGASPLEVRIKIRLSDEDCQFARGLLDDLGLSRDMPWITIHAGASASSRRYDPVKFARVAARLRKSFGIRCLFTGSEQEIELVETIRGLAGVESFSLAGKLSLGQFAAFLSFSPLLLSNNSGPVHLASAVGTPVVDLYALTNPQHTPWLVPNRVLSHDVPCKYCYKSICPLGHHDCLNRIEPEEVVQAVIDLLAECRSMRQYARLRIAI
jgi:lipopolysaccharide heptosyltransferase II